MVDSASEHLERLARLLFRELDLAGAKVHLCERRDYAGGVDVVAASIMTLKASLKYETASSGFLLEAQGADLVEELPDVGLVAELLVERLGLLRCMSAPAPSGPCAR